MDSQSVAADGKTKVYGAGVVGAMPLMVRAVDFNALHAECVRLRSAVMSGEGEWVGNKELAALREDAKRYRKLRDGQNWPAAFARHDAPEPLRGVDLDAACDGAA